MELSLLAALAAWMRSLIYTVVPVPFVVDFVMTVVGVAALLGIISMAAIVFTYAERKICAFIQVRLGPNRVGGRFGLLQPIADMLKLMSKEDIMPAGADKVVWALSPALLFVPAGMISSLRYCRSSWAAMRPTINIRSSAGCASWGRCSATKRRCSFRCSASSC